MTSPAPDASPLGHRVLDDVWVPLSDGTRLAARIWLPDRAATVPVPAVLEYLPYRAGDGTTVRDTGVHGYFARHGYAGVRVDIRGTGDSGGTFTDEYSPQEHADAVEVIAWIAAQPWCDGNLGMMGISWGGFNSLQVAALRPPALKAIVTVCSTDDRYGDDCHFQGGSVIGDDMLAWGTTLVSIVAAPALHPGEDTRSLKERWRARIDGLRPPAHTWLEHQLLDDYWRHGSVNQDYAAIQAATLVVGGWADGYRNAAVRLVEHLTCPRRGIIGPWAHRYPHEGRPGPAIDFLAECVRWWDQWLRGHDTGAMDEPLLRTWVHDWSPPTSQPAERRGRWVALTDWSSAPAWKRHLADRRLTAYAAVDAPPVPVSCRQDTGLEAGAWCAYGNPGDTAPDQRLVDAGWVGFDDARLTAPVEVFGFPRLRLRLSSDTPLATVCVRLCDVAPDGSSLLVSSGVLNLTHRGGHERPEPLPAGRAVDVVVQLDALAHRFAAGHRVRVSVSNTWFPRVWPSPLAGSLTLHPGEGCVVMLPLLNRALEHPDLAAPSATVLDLAVDDIRPPHHERVVTRHFSDQGERAELVVKADGGRRILGATALHAASSEDRYRIDAQDPLSATVECRRSYTVGCKGTEARVEVVARMSADAGAFHLHTEVLALLDGRQVHRRQWDDTVPRQLL